MKVAIPEANPRMFIFKTRYYKKDFAFRMFHSQYLCKLNAYFRDRLCSMSNTTSLFRRNFISFAYDLQNKSFSLLRRTPNEGRLWQFGMFSMLSKNSFHTSALASLEGTTTTKKSIKKKGLTVKVLFPAFTRSHPIYRLEQLQTIL